MTRVKEIIEREVIEIEGVEVNFNWRYIEGEMPSRISANASDESGLNCQLAININPEGDNHTEVQIYGIKDELPIALINEIIANFETIIETLNK